MSTVLSAPHKTFEAYLKGALRDIGHFGSHFGFLNHTKTFKMLVLIMLKPYKRHNCIQIISRIC